MKRGSREIKRTLWLAAIALSSASLIFILFTALSSPAVADQTTAPQTTQALRLLPAEQKRDQNPDVPVSDEKPEETSNSEPRKHTAPSGKRSVYSDPTRVKTSPVSSTLPTKSSLPGTTSPSTKTQLKPQVASSVPTSAPASTHAPLPASTIPATTKPTTTPVSTPAPTTQAPAPVQTGSYNRSSTDDFVALLNQYRAASAVAALNKCPNLTYISECRSVEIVTDFSHAGIYKYGSYGENIFVGSGLDKYNWAATVLDSFKKSPAHNDNLLNSGYKNVGVGHYITSADAHYWVVVFGY